MSMVKLKDYQKEMAVCEALMGYKRADLLEKFKEHLSSLDAVNRVMNDPLMVEYKEELIRERNERVMENVIAAEKVVMDNLELAANTIADIMKDKDLDPQVRLRAAIDNLNRGGVKSKDDMDVKKTPCLTVEYTKKSETA